MVNDVVYDCQQFHSGLGSMREAIIERIVRECVSRPSACGATEVTLEEVPSRL